MAYLTKALQRHLLELEQLTESQTQIITDLQSEIADLKSQLYKKAELVQQLEATCASLRTKIRPLTVSQQLSQIHNEEQSYLHSLNQLTNPVDDTTTRTKYKLPHQSNIDAQNDQPPLLSQLISIARYATNYDIKELVQSSGLLPDTRLNAQLILNSIIAYTKCNKIKKHDYDDQRYSNYLNYLMSKYYKGE